MRWSHETVALEAKKYKHRRKFEKGSGGAYKYAKRHNILDEVCSHMEVQRIRWTKESCHKEAVKYETRNDFKKACIGAYNYARYNNYIDEVCSHMFSGKVTRWTKATCHTEALKFETRSAFKDSTPAYYYARNNNLLDEVCSHMTTPTVWTDATCHAEALKFETRTYFKEGNGGAYNYATRNNITDEVCSHMVDVRTCDGDMVYLWRVPNTNIYKIGVSSVRLGDTRIKDVAKELDKGCEIIGMYEVSNAFEVEAELHSTYQIEPTTLPKVDGHTEFRILGESDVNEITYYLENVVGKKL